MLANSAHNRCFPFKVKVFPRNGIIVRKVPPDFGIATRCYPVRGKFPVLRRMPLRGELRIMRRKVIESRPHGNI